MTSTSWPTPQTTGRLWATTARTTRSSLNDQRSSRLPPPRARIVSCGASSGRPSVRHCSIQRSSRRNARHDARRRVVALDLARDEDDAGQRPAPRQDVADVAPDDAGRARDDGDRRRARRQRPLAGRVEQALLGQLRLERLEPERQVAEARRLDRLDVELERALRLEQVDPAVDDDPEAGLGLERRADPLVAEPDALERAAVVLEAEVGVARGADRHPADLALDPDVAQPLVGADGVADGPRDLADAEDLQPERAGRRAGFGSASGPASASVGGVVPWRPRRQESSSSVSDPRA